MLDRGLMPFRRISENNSSPSFTSMGARVDTQLTNAGRGVYTFRINRAIFHKIRSLLPPPGRHTQFAHIYIHDPERQVDRCNAIFQRKLNISILWQPQDEFSAANHYFWFYKFIRNLEQDLETMQLRIVLWSEAAPNGRPQRKYDLPSSSGVAW